MQIRGNNLFSDNRNPKDSCFGVCCYTDILTWKENYHLGKKMSANVDVIENNYILIVFSLMKKFHFQKRIYVL